MTPAVGVREFARRRGVSHQAVQRAISTGRIDARREKRGKKLVYFIDPDAADKQWNERTDFTYRRSQTRAEKAAGRQGSSDGQRVPDPVEDLRRQRGFKNHPAGARAQAPGEQVQPTGPGVPNTLYGQAKTARETYAAKMAEVQYRRAIGELLDAGLVGAFLYGLAATVRDNIMNVPVRVSAVLAAESNARVIQDILDAELKTAPIAIADSENLTEKVKREGAHE